LGVRVALFFVKPVLVSAIIDSSLFLFLFLFLFTSARLFFIFGFIYIYIYIYIFCILKSLCLEAIVVLKLKERFSRETHKRKIEEERELM